MGGEGEKMNDQGVVYARRDYPGLFLRAVIMVVDVLVISGVAME